MALGKASPLQCISGKANFPKFQDYAKTCIRRIGSKELRLW